MPYCRKILIKVNLLGSKFWHEEIIVNVNERMDFHDGVIRERENLEGAGGSDADIWVCIVFFGKSLIFPAKPLRL